MNVTASAAPMTALIATSCTGVASPDPISRTRYPMPTSPPRAPARISGLRSCSRSESHPAPYSVARLMAQLIAVMVAARLLVMPNVCTRIVGPKIWIVK